MSIASANGQELFYDTTGDAKDPALLLIMGLGSQMVAWPDGFVSALAKRGFHVIRFDNRDVGLSSKSTSPAPDAFKLFSQTLAGEDVADQIPYSLSDMAADSVDLLDALDIEKVHGVGTSMGGMILQHIAIEHPNRLNSAASMMSTTGDPTVGSPSPEAFEALLRPAPTDKEAVIEHHVANRRIFAGPLFDEDFARSSQAAFYNRSYTPLAGAFHMAAIMASGDRTKDLAQVDIPFVAIHGDSDSLIDMSGGVATSEAVPNAKLAIFEKMGHNLPESLWTRIIDAIADNAVRGAPTNKQSSVISATEEAKPAL